MEIKRWQNPNDANDVRYYINCKFAGPKYGNYALASMFARNSKMYIGKSVVGSLYIFSGKRAHEGIGEDSHEVIEYLELTTFEAFEARYAASLTKGGNFSEVRYFAAIEAVEQSAAA